jgi:hypothetical protein
MSTTYSNPWDAEIDSGGGWTDRLVSHWDGKAVFVTRNIASPEAQCEYTRLTFPDGSVLYFGFDADGANRTRMILGIRPLTCAFALPACHAPPMLATEASKACAEWVRGLYDHASAKEIDTDL